MGTTNFGNQTLSFDYKSPGQSETFNKLNYQLLEKGIYSGGLLSYNDATHINVEPMVVYITDTASEVGVRVKTSASIVLEVASGSPFVVARFAWSNVENNYMDILAVGFGSILADDLILGRCTFPSGALSATFDYARKSTVFNVENRTIKTNLTVIPTEPYSDQVYIYGGTFFNSEKQVTVTGSNSSAFSGVNPNTITNGRIDLVYIDDAGAIQIEQGIDEAGPTAPLYNSRKVLAEVYLDNTNIYIDGNDITLVNSTDSGQQADDLMLGTAITSSPTGGTATNLTTEDFIDDAFVEVFTRLRDASGIANDSIDSRHYAAGSIDLEHMSVNSVDSDQYVDDSIDDIHINWGTGANQVSAGDVPILDSGGKYVGTNVESVLAEIAMPIGTIIMFDANNTSGASGNSGAWVDNSTLPGWYACISGNSTQSCPDLVDKFVLGKVVAGAGATGGSHTHTITSAQLPTHIHTISHTHGTDSDSHSHTVPNMGTAAISYATGGGTFLNNTAVNRSTSDDAHTHTTNSQTGTDSGDGGFANDTIPTKPAYYSIIYIRKCS